MDAAERAKKYMQVKGLMAGGMAIVPACREAGISRASFDRWGVRFESGGVDGLEDLPRSGRPPLVELSAEEAQYLRKTYVRSNLTAEGGSMTMAARWSAKNPESPLSDETRAAILKPRASKHTLPVEVRRACRASTAEVVRYRQGSKAGLSDGIYTPGWLRMADDGSRRLVPGERQVWDDASVNVGVVVPWARGGDVTSDKYGVRVARFQLLLALDCATDMAVGYSYVMRSSDGYGASDVCGALHRVWQLAGYAPNECVMEGGAWQAERTTEMLAAAGVRMISAKGRPNQKLVEGFFNRLWTVLSIELPPRGQVGRFRGEMATENKEWMRARAGRVDPREIFPTVTEFLGALDRALLYLNQEVMESRDYGSWVPADVYAGQAAKGHALMQGLRRFALPVRELRTVGRGGMVRVAADDPFGYRHDYRFASERSFAFIDAPVVVSFDPCDIEAGAIIELAEHWRDHRKGEIIASAAACVSSPAELIRVGDGWVVHMRDSRQIATETKRKSRALIGTQVAALDERGIKARHATAESAPGEVERQFGLGAVAAVVPAYVPVDLDALQLEDAEDWARQEKRAVGVW